MTDSPDRFKRTAHRRYQQVGTQTHRKGTTLDIVPFSPIAHKHTAIESVGCWIRRLASVFTQARTQLCTHNRRTRR
jgi:hypothetical protein